MPVADHPIHPSVIKTVPHARCHNRAPFAAGYYARDRQYMPDGRWIDVQVWIPHTLSTQCRQTLALPECEACEVEKDTEYLEVWK